MRHATFSLLLALLSSFTFLAAQPGNALSFDGTNDNVTATLPPLFNNIAANDFTLEAWVYPTGAIFSRIIYAQSSTTNFATMSTGASNQIYFYVIANGTTYSVATNASLPSNTWTHVAARWTAATLTPVVFFNGVQQATIAGGGSSTGSLSNLSIGTRPGGAQYFPGRLDEVRIWSGARSQCAIAANMNRTFTGPQANLVAYYTFDQGVAGGTNTGVNTLTDLSGNAYTGTLNNFALTGASSNWIASAANITSSGNELPNGFQAAVSAGVCPGGSYTFPNGSTQTNITAPVVQTSILTTSLGCDSTITTTLSILPTSLDTVAASVCPGGSYTFPNGSTQTNITAPVVQTSTLTNSLGCDSVITTTLSISPISSDTVAALVCSGSSYTFPDGSIDTNITTQVTQTSILQNSAGCDSVITTTVNVANNYFLFAVDSICVGADYQFPDSTLITNITTSTTYTSQLLSVAGCDSFITTTVNPMLLDTAVTVNGFTLTATASASGYQWFNCATSLPVPNGNTQSYSPTANGSYAVYLFNAQGCVEASSCFTVIVIGRPDPTQPQLLAYPNPNPGSFLLRLPEGSPLPADIEVFNAVGQRVYLGQATTTEHQIQLAEAPAGVYTLRAHLAEGSLALRLVVSR
jgi:Concanavalin A-like lectin/glucanases superfamily